MIKKILVVLLAFTLSACGVFFDTDNTPEPTPLTTINTNVTPRVLWSANTGSGAGDEHLTMSPAISGNAIYTSNANGVITSINKNSGTINWKADTDLSLTSGPGAGNDIVVAGSRTGEIIALNAADGAVRWKSKVNSQILANPVVKNQTVLVKSIDGYVRAFSSIDGKRLWSLKQTEPNLILRGSSTPAVENNDAVIGFANGRLIKVNLVEGRMLWSQTLAYPQGGFAIERMIDIDADPVIHGHRIYAATYQGKIASLSWGSGQELWTHDISTYTGMAADDNNVYVSDAKGFLYSFNADSGLVNWRLGTLKARNISGPAVINNHVIVGDAEGYLHWINKVDGNFAARVKAGGPIIAAPIAQNGVLYALSNNGYLTAYKLG